MSNLVPCPLSINELKNSTVKVLEQYDILVNDDDELMFGIKFLGSDHENPKLYYDGGLHAILLKNGELAVVCDHIHPGAREYLFRANQVLFTEMQPSAKDEDSGIAEEYMAELMLCSGVTELAGELIGRNEEQEAAENSTAD